MFSQTATDCESVHLKSTHCESFHLKSVAQEKKRGEECEVVFALFCRLGFHCRVSDEAVLTCSAAQ